MKEKLQLKFDKLKDILLDMQKVLVAFSGGVDSTFLVKVADEVLGDNVLAVIATSETYPETEKKEAVRLAQEIGVRYTIIESCEMQNTDFVKNSPDRCYYCKTELFSKIKTIAVDENINYVLDGANFEDIGDYRPGSKAAEELGVRSPLKEAGLIREEIRELSRRVGLSTWNKPSMACLSSRFPYYTEINNEGLKQVFQAEEYLRSLGFSQVRVRHHGSMARIEIMPAEFFRVMQDDFRIKISQTLLDIGYTYVTLDLSGYRTGSMNEILPLDVKRET